MTAGHESMGPEEPWEAEIGALLGGLPLVDPPDGFISAALNHRPLHAGRIMAGLLALLVAVLGLGLVFDGTNGSLVAPEIEQLAQRHLQAQANLSSDTDSNSASNGAAEPGTTSDLADSMTFMPSGYERRATLDADELRQAVYAREGESISVFVQDGEVDWESLPQEGHTRVGGNRAWVDQDSRVTVVQADSETITIVGLSSGEVSQLISDLPGDDESVVDRLGDLASAVVGQLGFPTD